MHFGIEYLFYQTFKYAKGSSAEIQTSTQWSPIGRNMAAPLRSACLNAYQYSSNIFFSFALSLPQIKIRHNFQNTYYLIFVLILFLNCVSLKLRNLKFCESLSYRTGNKYNPFKEFLVSFLFYAPYLNMFFNIGSLRRRLYIFVESLIKMLHLSVRLHASNTSCIAERIYLFRYYY